MDMTTMIVLTLGLSCEGETARMCRMFGDPAAARGTPALSSTPSLQPASGQRSTNALRAVAERPAAPRAPEGGARW